MIGLPQYVSTFRDKSVEGHALLELGEKEVLMQTFWMNAQDATTLAACIDDLGDLDSVAILAEVTNEVESIRSGNTSSQPTESLTDSIAAFFGVNNSSATASASASNSVSASVKSTVQGVVEKYKAKNNGGPANRLAAEGPLVGSVNIVMPDIAEMPDPTSFEDEEGTFYDSGSDVEGQSEFQEKSAMGSNEDSGSDGYNPKSSVADPYDYSRGGEREMYAESSYAGSRRGERKGNGVYRGDDEDNDYGEGEYMDRSRNSSFGEAETRVRAGSDTIAGDALYYNEGDSEYSRGRGRRSRGGSSAGTSFIGDKAEAVPTSMGSDTDSDRYTHDEYYESEYSRDSYRSRRSRGVESSVSRPNASRRHRDRDRDRGNRRKSRSHRRTRERDMYGRDGEEGEDEEMSYKVVMVGIVGVGKKSLMKRFGGAEFSSSEISQMSKHFISSDVDRFVIKTWDDKGQAVRDQLSENR